MIKKEQIIRLLIHFNLNISIKVLLVAYAMSRFNPPAPTYSIDDPETVSHRVANS